MEKIIYINIQNLFNGNVMTFKDKIDALYYVKYCIRRDVPITINYGYKYVN